MSKTNFDIRLIFDIFQNPCLYCEFEMSSCRKECFKGIFKYIREKINENKF